MNANWTRLATNHTVLRDTVKRMLPLSNLLLVCTRPEAQTDGKAGEVSVGTALGLAPI